MQFIARTPEETMRIAARIAALCRPGDCLLLRGDLGAGKTVFARGFIRALCPEAGEVASPTFSLVQAYDAPGGLVVTHADLYRLRHAEEIHEIGLLDGLPQGIALVEWPQIIAPYWPQEALLVDMEYAGAETERRMVLTARGPAWERRLPGMQA